MRRLRRGVLDLAWYTLEPTSTLVGHSISTSAVRRETGVPIVALLREDVVVHNPGPETLLCAGDQIGVLGTTPQRAAFAELLLAPPGTSQSSAPRLAGLPSAD